MREIPLSRGAVALVGDEDFERVSLYKWSLDRNGYAVRAWRVGNRRCKVMLHRFILCAPRGYDVDHKDGNLLNCTRENIRICTRAQNNANSRGRTGTSKYKGVRLSRRRWRVEICADGQRINVGTFSDEIEAAQAYDTAAIRYHGEFARLNFPRKQKPALVPPVVRERALS